MVEINDQLFWQIVFMQCFVGGGDIFGVIVWLFVVVYNNMFIWIVVGLVNCYLILFVWREEYMVGVGGVDGVYCDVCIVVGVVFKFNWVGEC